MYYTFSPCRGKVSEKCMKDYNRTDISSLLQTGKRGFKLQMKTFHELLVLIMKDIYLTSSCHWKLKKTVKRSNPSRYPTGQRIRNLLPPTITFPIHHKESKHNVEVHKLTNDGKKTKNKTKQQKKTAPFSSKTWEVLIMSVNIICIKVHIYQHVYMYTLFLGFKMITWPVFETLFLTTVNTNKIIHQSFGDWPYLVLYFMLPL